MEVDPPGASDDWTSGAFLSEGGCDLADVSSCPDSSMDVANYQDLAPDMTIDESYISKMVFLSVKVCKLCQHGAPLPLVVCVSHVLPSRCTNYT